MYRVVVLFDCLLLFYWIVWLLLMLFLDCLLLCCYFIFLFCVVLLDYLLLCCCFIVCCCYICCCVVVLLFVVVIFVVCVVVLLFVVVIFFVVLLFYCLLLLYLLLCCCYLREGGLIANSAVLSYIYSYLVYMINPLESVYKRVQVWQCAALWYVKSGLFFQHMVNEPTAVPRLICSYFSISQPWFIIGT